MPGIFDLNEKHPFWKSEYPMMILALFLFLVALGTLFYANQLEEKYIDCARKYNHYIRNPFDAYNPDFDIDKELDENLIYNFNFSQDDNRITS